jgi:hypothetical protein
VLISPELYERFFRTIYNCATFSSYILALAKDFGAKNMLSYKKCAHKMLMKLTPGVDFTNVLQAAFTLADPKSAKRH